MKKVLASIALLVLIGWAVWASTLREIPSTEFPALPQAPGTLGAIFDIFGDDGTASNAVTIGHIPQTQFLKNTLCTSPGEVWRGIDMAGNAICQQNRNLLSLGRFCEVPSASVRVMRGGNPPEIAVDASYQILPWDIINTHAGTASICFDSDSSILRLDTNTIVNLQLWELRWETVAQAILQDGRLWGRILTSTGVNIWWGGLIAWVRGTSISLNRSSLTYSLGIPHSQRPLDASTLMLEEASIWGATTRSLPVRKSVSYTHSPTLDSIYQWDINLVTSYSSDAWMRDNTIADLQYMFALPQTPYIRSEILATIPTSLWERRQLCRSSTGIWNTYLNTCVLAEIDYTRGDARAYTHSAELWLERVTVRTKIEWPARTQRLYLQDDGRIGGYTCDIKRACGYRRCVDRATWWWARVSLGRYYTIDEILWISRDLPSALPTLNDLKRNGVTRMAFFESYLNQPCESTWSDRITYNIGLIQLDRDATIDVTPRIAGWAVTITGSGYIDYNLARIWDTSWKTIQIELNRTPQWWSVLMDASNCELKWLGSRWATARWCTLLPGSTSRIVSVRINSRPSYMSFWNKRDHTLPIRAGILRILFKF